MERLKFPPKTQLGKIQNVSFGRGGYQDGMIGIAFSLGGKSWGVSDFWGYWSSPPPEGAEWNLADQERELGRVTLRIAQLLRDADVDDVSKLAGVPVEVSFDDNKLVGWRVLTEVV